MADSADGGDPNSSIELGDISGTAGDVMQAQNLHKGDIVHGAKLVAHDNGTIVHQVGETITNVTEMKSPPASRLVPPLKARGRRDPDFVGRAQELEELTRKLGIGAEAPDGDGSDSFKEIYVHATAEGWGKSAFLRELAFADLTSVYPHGVIQVDAAHLTYVDIRQELYERTHVWHGEAPLYLVSDSQVSLALADVRAVIILDDLDLEPAQRAQLFDLAPKCAFVMGVTSFDRGDFVTIARMDPEEARELFTTQAGINTEPDFTIDLAATPDAGGADVEADGPDPGGQLAVERQTVGRIISTLTDYDAVERIIEALSGRPASLTRFGARVHGDGEHPPLTLAAAVALAEKHGELWPLAELEADETHGAGRMAVVERLAAIDKPAPKEFVHHLSQTYSGEDPDWLWANGIAAIDHTDSDHRVLDADGEQRARVAQVVQLDEVVRHHLKHTKTKQLRKHRHSLIDDVDQWTEQAHLSSDLARSLVPYLVEILTASAESGDRHECEIADRVAGRLREVVDMSLWPGLAAAFFDVGVDVADVIGPEAREDAEAWRDRHQEVHDPEKQRSRIGRLLVGAAAVAAAIWAFFRLDRLGWPSWLGGNGTASPAGVLATLLLLGIGVSALTFGAIQIFDRDNTQVDITIIGPDGRPVPVEGSVVNVDWGGGWEGFEGTVTRSVTCGDEERHSQQVAPGEAFEPIEFGSADANQCQITVSLNEAETETGAQGLHWSDGELALAQTTEVAYESVLVIDRTTDNLEGLTITWSGDFQRLTLERRRVPVGGRSLEFRLREGTGGLIGTGRDLPTVGYVCESSEQTSRNQILVPAAPLAWRTPAIAAGSMCEVFLLLPDRGADVGWSASVCDVDVTGRRFDLALADCSGSAGNPVDIEVGLTTLPSADVEVVTSLRADAEWVRPGDLSFHLACVDPLGEAFSSQTVDPLAIGEVIREEMPVGSTCTLTPTNETELADFVLRGRPDARTFEVTGTTTLTADVTPITARLRLVHDIEDGAPAATGILDCVRDGTARSEVPLSIAAGAAADWPMAAGSRCTIELDAKTGWEQSIDGTPGAFTVSESTTLVLTSRPGERSTRLLVRVSTAGSATNDERVTVGVRCTQPDGSLLNRSVTTIGVTELDSVPRFTTCAIDPVARDGGDATWRVDGQTLGTGGTVHTVTITEDATQTISAVLSRQLPPPPRSTSTQVIVRGPQDTPVIPVNYRCTSTRTGSAAVGNPLGITEVPLGGTCAVTVNPVAGWTMTQRLEGADPAPVASSTTINVGADRALVLEMRRIVDVALSVRRTTVDVDVEPHDITVSCPDVPNISPISPVLHQDLAVGPIPAETYCEVRVAGLAKVRATINGQELRIDEATQIFVPDAPRHVIAVVFSPRTGPVLPTTRSLTIGIASGGTFTGTVTVPWSCEDHSETGPFQGGPGETFTTTGVADGTICTVGPATAPTGWIANVTGGGALLMDRDRTVSVTLTSVTEPNTPPTRCVQAFGVGLIGDSTDAINLSSLDRTKVARATLVWAGSPDTDDAGDEQSSLTVNGQTVAGTREAKSWTWRLWSGDVTALVRSSGPSLTIGGWATDRPASRDERNGATLYVVLDGSDCGTRVAFAPGGLLQRVNPKDADAANRTATLRWDNLTAMSSATNRSASIHLSFAGPRQDQCRPHTLTIRSGGAVLATVDHAFGPPAACGSTAPICTTLMAPPNDPHHEWSTIRCNIDLPPGADDLEITLVTNRTPRGISGTLVGGGVLEVKPVVLR